MFYKDDYLDKNTIEEYNTTYSREFSLALYEKVSIHPDYALAQIVGDKEGETQCIKYVITTLKDKYMNIEGERSLSFFSIRSYQQQTSLENIRLQPVSLSDLLATPINQEKYVQAQSIVKDFFNLKEDCQIKDKFGELYQLKYIENADSSIGSSLIVDEVILFKDNKQIAFLKAKYTNDEIEAKLINQLDKKFNSSFNNIAGVDFSQVDEEYKNRGLGYVMYFYMAKNLNEKDIKFRSSSLQSPSAKRLWNALKNHFSDNIELFANQENYLFNVAKTDTLSFIKEIPQIVKNEELKYLKLKM